MRGLYKAEMGGGSWSRAPVAEFSTIGECRVYAESYGDTADWCVITDWKGRKVAEHRRAASRPFGWYRAEAVA